MRIASWNVNSLNARLPRVEEWLERMQPDVVCMQETKLDQDAFPTDVYAGLGYESVHYGEGRWNGVAILSRVGLDDVTVGFEDGNDKYDEARAVWATCGGVRVASLYVPNGREVGHDHYHYKLEWLGRLRAHLDSNHRPDEPLALLGDFNIAPRDIDVWDRKAFEGATHVTEPERGALDGVTEWGLTDTFTHLHGETEGLFTYYDYTAGRFHKRQGIRIDLILASDPLLATLGGVLIDRNGRKSHDGNKPSDHVPIYADFAI